MMHSNQKDVELRHIFGIGTDIVEIARIARLCTKYNNFRSRVLTKHELLDPRSDRYDFVAGRWAAKESVAKAIGSGFTEYFRMSDISILNGLGGKPVVMLEGPTKEYLESIYSKYIIHISISHDSYATAFCVIEVVDCSQSN